MPAMILCTMPALILCTMPAMITLHNAASPPRGSTGILRAGGGGSTGGTEEAGDGATSAQAEAVTPLLGPLEAEDLPVSPPVSPHISDP